MPEPTRDDLAAMVREVLASMGESMDAVARTLRAAGITGEVDDVCGCPVARFLAARIPELRRPDGSFAWYVNADSVSYEYGGAAVPTPPAVEDFIEAFDDLAPELDDLRTAP